MFTENQGKGGEGKEDMKRAKNPKITPKVPKHRRTHYTISRTSTSKNHLSVCVYIVLSNPNSCAC